MHPNIVSKKDWLAARKALLAEEENLREHREAVTAARRSLPMVDITGDHVFEGGNGPVTLEEVFDGRRQLIVYHFMFQPDWTRGCPDCTRFVNDLGHLPHLHAEDTTLALISRAPWEKLDAYRATKGWDVPWYSSFGTTFNDSYHTSSVGPWEGRGDQMPGISVFLREDDRVFHTYSSYLSGADAVVFTTNYLDLTPLER